MNVSIHDIPHKDQRYETVGDWQVRAGKLREIRISHMKNEDFVFLVGLHELIEGYLCVKRGITQRAVDRFDMDYERRRVEGDTSEPGDDPRAPYYKEHQIATLLEKLMAFVMGVDWKEYEEAINAL